MSMQLKQLKLSDFVFEQASPCPNVATTGFIGGILSSAALLASRLYVLHCHL